MPNFLFRWTRSTISVFVAVLMSLAIVGVSIADGVIVSVDAATFDRNWHGLYDILVTPAGQTFDQVGTNDLVDPNFVSTAGAGGISEGQLSKIRAIAGVDVAAPVGLVGTISAPAQAPSLALNDDPEKQVTDLADQSQLMRLTATLSSGSAKLSQSTGVVKLDRRTSSTITVPAKDGIQGYPNGFAPQANNLYMQVPLGQLPAIPSSVIAIDPVAEMKLLGANASFLKALVKSPVERSSAAGSEWIPLVDSKRFLVQQTEIQQAVADHDASRSIVPLVVNGSSSAKLTLSVKVETEALPLGSALSIDQLQKALTSGQFTSSEVLTKDVSSLTVPFSSPDLSMLLPGSSLPAGESAGSFYSSTDSLRPQLAGRPAYSPSKAPGDTSSAAPKFDLRPLGAVAADGSSPNPSDAQQTGANPSVGLVQTYKHSRDANSEGRKPVIAAPVGTFATNELTAGDISGASYVPSGVYDGAVTTVVQPGPMSHLSPGDRIEPNLSGLDFITAPPGAFTDLEGGASLRGSAPIDAIRVRVAGVSSYNQANVAKVEKVAASIAELGLRTTIVAGSSPEPVSVYVPKYYLSDDGKSASDLGWVRQDWTTLGAAVTVESAISSLQRALVFTSLATAFVALLAVSIVLARRRRNDVQLYRSLGWSTPSVIRYLGSSQVPTITLVGVTALACAYFAGSREATITAGVVGVVGSLFAAVVFVALALRTGERRVRRPQSRSRKLAVTPSSIALRHVRDAPGPFLAQVAGVTAVGLSVSLTLASLASARAQSATRLSSLVLDSSTVASIALGLTGAAAATVLVILARGSENARLSEDATVMRAVGFPGSSVRAVTTTYTAILAASSLLLVAIGSTLLVELGPGSGDEIAAALGASLVALIAIHLNALRNRNHGSRK
jgi:hypothetical protein